MYTHEPRTYALIFLLETVVVSLTVAPLLSLINRLQSKLEDILLQ